MFPGKSLVENSRYDMGLIEAFAHNWQYVFQILEDYLYWTLNEADPESHFLTFGGKSIPTKLNIAELLTILNALLGHIDHRLKRRRERYKPESSTEGGAGEAADHFCDFCGGILSDAVYERLEDGRERCPDCKKSAVELSSTSKSFTKKDVPA